MKFKEDCFLGNSPFSLLSLKYIFYINIRKFRRFVVEYISDFAELRNKD